MRGKCIVVGVTGGIAVYKAAELVSSLVKEGAEVHVIMTRSAQEFVTPLTFQTLSKNPVIVDMFEEPKSWEVQHIALADKADLFAIVPATANIIGKIANGIADDMLTTTVMATQAPILLAPAMNVHMYENPIVQRNINYLEELGYHFVDPGFGRLACGYEGKGRLASISEIQERMYSLLKGAEEELRQDLAGVTVLVTAGGTREAIDPVRYISNHSSGKMGYVIAENALLRGAKVTLISGPANLQPPSGVQFIGVETAQEMHASVLEEFANTDVIIKAAAVADYRPKACSNQKIKKEAEELVLELIKNPDILGELGRQKGEKILVGFAAESSELLANAASKLKKKNLDMIVANDITLPGAGFNHDTNIVKFIFPDGNIEELPLLPKREVAKRILDKVVALVEGRRFGEEC